MNDEKFKLLISKLDKELLHHGGSEQLSVSPTHVPVGFGPPGTLFKNMDFDLMDEEDLLLTHANLHRFYPVGIGDVTKKDIERLHAKIRTKIKHKDFDILDRNDGHE